MAAQTVYLVSGSNRGIGLGLVRELSQRDNTVVFAGARNPAAALELQSLAKSVPGKVHIVKLESAHEGEAKAAAAEIKKVAGRLDVVIANAAMSACYKPALETPPAQMREHFEVNTLGPLVLFQACYPLLRESTPSPKFVVISSAAASITAGPPMGFNVLAYGTSKAAVNYLTRKLHFEHQELVCFALSPGPVNTELATGAAEDGSKAMRDFLNLNINFKSVEEASAGIMKQIDKATRESASGAFAKWDPDGGRWDW